MSQTFSIITIALFGLNLFFLAGIQTTLKFMIMRNRQMEARVETLMLETMFSRES